MKNKSLICAGIFLPFLIACQTHKVETHSLIDDPDGIAIAGEKFKTIEQSCFYQSSRPEVPDDLENTEFQYVAIGTKGKNPVSRFRTITNTPLDQALQSAQDASNFTEWYGQLPNLRTQRLRPSEVAVPPFIPNRKETVRRPVPQPYPNPFQPANSKFRQHPSQLDVIMFRHTRLSFVLLDDNLTFNEMNPFEVYSGSGQNLPPFYYLDKVQKLNDEKTILTVEFYIDGEQIVSKGDCAYDYQLNVVSTEIIDGVEYKTNLTYDPGGGDGFP